MSLGLTLVFAALIYLGLLFLVAHWGDRRARDTSARTGVRLWIYPLSLAVYCTSWTFFGSVGLASRQGFDFLAIYVGPIIMFGLMWPFVLRVIRIAKAQNITSVADFIGARYGKNQTVAAMVALICTVGIVPYVALQLKAVSSSLLVTLQPSELARVTTDLPFFGDLALLVAMAMAAFAMLFGTRHADATEHQDGLMLAIAMESVVKLVCFLIVGAYILFVVFAGPADLIDRARAIPDLPDAVIRVSDVSTFMVMCLLSFCCALLLPRMFHVGVVENQSPREVRRAAWIFPAYLVAINLFVVPIAVAGLVAFPVGSIDSDMTMMALPLAHGDPLVTLVTFIGGLSAATAMVIVACVALSIMLSNDIVIPAMLKLRGRLPGIPDLQTSAEDVGQFILAVRRTIILFILVAAYLYYRAAGDAQLAAIGLLSFAAVAQLAPAFFGGMVWRGANARGAIAGMGAGTALWFYTLLIPMLVQTGAMDRSLVDQGPLGIVWLRPQALFGIDMPPLTHGVLWSLTVNVIFYLAFSLSRRARPIEALQADIFAPAVEGPATPSFRLWRPAVTVDELQRTVARYLGSDRTMVAFRAFATEHAISLEPNREADIALVRHAERMLASAIGAASSRLVLSLMLRKRTVTTEAAFTLLDGAHAAMQYNREILQAALEHARQAVSVLDAEGKLVVWNRPFAEALDLPPGVLRVGAGLQEVLEALAERGEFGPGDVKDLARTRAERIFAAEDPLRERFLRRGLVVEIRTARLPDGGVVTTYTDVTANVAAEEELERANERLEQRVRERTEELTRLNGALAQAKAEADEANLSKTRFLAAASHDILQPLNAARLYTTSLVDRLGQGPDKALVGNIEASLESVEEILGALLDISRLDAGAMKPEMTVFRIDELMRQMAVEFTPLAAQKGLTLTVMPCSLSVRSDRRLLRRALQNLISNAIKYTPAGEVLVGCRRRGNQVRIQVLDTGPGIPQRQQSLVFKEFQRLDQGARAARGLGLGLSIVQRIARVLSHRLTLTSRVGKGSCFALDVPTAAPLPQVAATPTLVPSPAMPLEGLVVLAIDNEPQILEGMTTLLSGWGCRVFAGHDAREASAAIAGQHLRPHVLIVDYHLDEGTGIDAVKQLRWRFGEDRPAVLITADRSPAVRDEAEAAGIALLHKPLKPAQLRAMLSQWRLRAEAAE